MNSLANMDKKLTRKQQEVVDLMVAGKTIGEIAKDLGVTYEAVRHRLSAATKIIDKSDVDKGLLKRIEVLRTTKHQREARRDRRSDIVNVVRMLKILRQTGDYVKSFELANALGVDVRTIRRYSYSLLAAGYNVISLSGSNGGYKLIEERLEEYEWIILKSKLLQYTQLYEKICEILKK
jgi:hypothetical protein